MALPFFAITLFVSAFLLFLVQPMIGKMILPKLGGTPQVWNTCMVFFQTALLAGYAYTHTVSTRLSVRRQLFVHCAVLVLPLFVLFLWPYGPFNVADPVGPDGKPIVVDGKVERGWIPNPEAPPIPQTLGLLLAMVGVPFIVVATSAPLLQKWFGSTGHPAAKDPYFLYGASNLGSMLALLAYPFIVEPIFGLREQAWIWTFGYIVLALAVAGCAYFVLQAPPSVQLAGASTPIGSTAEQPAPEPVQTAPAPAPAPAAETAIKPVAAPNPPAPQRGAIRRGSKQRGGRPQPAKQLGKVAVTSATAAAHAPLTHTPAAPRPFEMTNWRRFRWVMLAAIPSSLMLGVTTYMCTDISAITNFWVIPLAIYLLSFILVFTRWPVVWTGAPHSLMLILQPFGLICLTWILMTHQVSPIWRSVLFCMVAFFFTALVCHGELARDRPPTRYLTEFYLWMSVGGMLGGMFNGLVAPVLFYGTAELPLAIIFAGLLRPRLGGGGWSETWLASTFPEMANWFNKTGDDLYSQFKGQPTAAADGTTPAPTPAPAVQAPRGWLMGFTFDLVIAGLITVVAATLIFNGSGHWGWKVLYNSIADPYVKEMDKENSLFAFFHRTMGMAPKSAHGWTQTMSGALMYGLPLILALLVMSRPLRFGLALAGILLVVARHEAAAESGHVLQAERTYFGVLRVMTQKDGFGESHYLMHGTTHHGLNYMPEVRVAVFDVNGNELDKSHTRPLGRLATTYYHRLGPTGIIMEKLNWFDGQYGVWVKDGKVIADPKEREKDKDKIKLEKFVNYKGTFNDYSADARLPVAVIGLGAGNPLGQVLASVSEPPYATIGLGTGTMASYGRPYQHVVYYEIDEVIRGYSLKDDPYFTYVRDAIDRGVKLEIVMGDARLSMTEERLQPDTTYTWTREKSEGHHVYEKSTSFPKRENYYRAIEVDAFSSDAIPVHLITREAIAMYFTKLVKHNAEFVNPVTGKKVYQHGGILCVHTSNRHVDLVKPVTDVARSLKKVWRVGKDGTQPTERRRARGEMTVVDYLHIGHFGQEYVMVADDERDLPEDQRGGEGINPGLTWYTPRAPGNRVWTDDYSYLMGVFRWGFDRGE